MGDDDLPSPPAGDDASFADEEGSAVRRAHALPDVIAQLLQARRIELGCDAVESAVEATTLIETGRCEVLIVDEESAGGRLAELVQRVTMHDPAAEVIVVSRDFQATTKALAGLRIRHLVPKPVNAHILSSVLTKLTVMRSSAPPSTP